MKADYHLHTSFSSDSDASPKEMINKAMELGLSHICITDHMDKDFPVEVYHLDFQFNVDDYFMTLLKLKETYKNKININIGIELGLQNHLANDYTKLLSDYDFDFAIGSIHLVNKVDPYYPEYFDGRPSYEAYMEYFETMLNNIDVYSGYDVIGHIDYIFRYGPDSYDFKFDYKMYEDILDAILKKIISKDLGIELNTAGFKYGLGHPNPHEDIIKRYRDFGGEIITIGSDAHRPDHIAYDFSKVKNILHECGFKHYNIFEKRKAITIDI